MSQLDCLKIWEDAAIRDALAWYLAVPAAGQVPHRGHGPDELRPRRSERGRALGRARPADPKLPRALRGDPRGRTASGTGGPPEPAGAVPRACLPHARALQLLPVGLPRRTGVKLGACKLASGARVS